MARRLFKVRWISWVVVAACGVIIAIILGSLQTEIAPLEDRNSVRFTVTGAGRDQL
jgi:HAE1 family hydrophobic/amphiphilic exporter-1/multidrug efflux pump